MEKKTEHVFKNLQEMNVPFEILKHEKVHTIQECYDLIPLDWTQTVMPRNALVCNRQQTAFYLMQMSPKTPFKTSYVSHALGSSRLSFAPEEKLQSLLGCASGALSPLGLLFDEEKKVQLVMDEALRDKAYYAFHPCDAEATVVMRAEAFFEGFLEKMKKSICWLQMPKEEEE